MLPSAVKVKLIVQKKPKMKCIFHNHEIIGSFECYKRQKISCFWVSRQRERDIIDSEYSKINREND